MNQERVKSVCNKSVVQKLSIIKDTSFCDYKVKKWKESESKRVRKYLSILNFYTEDNVIKEYKCCRELNSFIKSDSTSK